MTDPQVMARLTGAVAEIAAQAAESTEPEAVRQARTQLDNLRARLINTLEQIRGIGCDLDWICRSRDEHPAIDHALGNMPANVEDNHLTEVLGHLVDVLTAVQWSAGRLDQWQPEEAAE